MVSIRRRRQAWWMQPGLSALLQSGSPSDSMSGSLPISFQRERGSLLLPRLSLLPLIACGEGRLFSKTLAVTHDQRKLVETFWRLRWGQVSFQELLFRLNPLEGFKLATNKPKRIMEGLICARWSLIDFLWFLSPSSQQGCCSGYPVKHLVIRF